MKLDLLTIIRRQTRRRRGRILIRPTVTPASRAVDLTAIYVRVLRHWSAEASARILPAYSESLPVAVGRLADGVSDVQAAIEAATQNAWRLLLEINPSLRAWVIEVEQWHRGQFARNMAGATGVDLSTFLGPAGTGETVETVLARNAALVRDVSNQAEARIADAVFRGLQAQTPRRQIAKEIDAALGLGRDRSRRIAVDQTTKLAVELDRARMEEMGFDRFIWRHSKKLHPREFHKERDGRVYLLRDDPDLAGDFPGQLPFCGCKPQAFLDLD